MDYSRSLCKKIPDDSLNVANYINTVFLGFHNTWQTQIISQICLEVYQYLSIFLNIILHQTAPACVDFVTAVQ